MLKCAKNEGANKGRQLPPRVMVSRSKVVPLNDISIPVGITLLDREF